MNEQLRIYDKMKDDFVSLASHELRTPMTAIKSYTWLLLNGKAGPMEPKAKEYVDRIYQSSERLIHLVNDMLDISRIESGRMQIRIAMFDMNELLSELKTEFQARITEKNITLQIAFGDLLQVRADREKIHQVLENLIDNAVKFTQPGGKITVSAEKTDGELLVSVTDTGKGISKEDQNKLFTKFTRLENSLVATTEKTTGLGLYICKQYVNLHSGQIWVQSEPGKGSTFSFILPIDGPPDSQNNSRV